MLDRIILASKYQHLRQKYDMASLPDGQEYVVSYNIAQDDNAYVVISQPNSDIQTSTMPTALQSFFQDKAPTRAIRKFKWGLDGVEKQTTYVIRSEGKRNTNNDLYYTGAKAIFLDHKYKRVIREQRCLVLVDAFIVGIKNKPFLVYLKGDKKAFGMAGLWNVTIDEKGQEASSFGVLTVPANRLLQRLGCDRMPVILDARNERRWTSKNTELSQVLSMLNTYPHQMMNAYPMSYKIRDKENNSLEVIQPVGGRIYNERHTMPSRKRVNVKRPIFDSPNMGEVAKMNRI